MVGQSATEGGWHGGSEPGHAGPVAPGKECEFHPVWPGKSQKSHKQGSIMIYLY